jgi:hypothetical protein
MLKVALKVPRLADQQDMLPAIMVSLTQRLVVRLGTTEPR